jgi:hypothetical protein
MWKGELRPTDHAATHHEDVSVDHQGADAGAKNDLRKQGFESQIKTDYADNH